MRQTGGILYSNADDPRVFVYRDENPEYGVMLNFAHRKARILMAAWIVLGIAPVALVWFSKTGFSAIAILIAFDVGLGVSVVVASIRGAVRDLKRHPGPKGPRSSSHGIQSLRDISDNNKAALQGASALSPLPHSPHEGSYFSPPPDSHL